MKAKPLNTSYNVLGLRLDIIPAQRGVETIMEWARRQESRMVCAANVHMTVEAWDNPEFGTMVNNADLVLLDGSGLAIGFALKYFKRGRRNRGPDFMLEVCKRAAEEGIEIGFYGGREEYRDKLLAFLLGKYPKLRVATFVVPPFREISESENSQYVETLNQSGAKIIFVGIGCPKQEKWISKNLDNVRGVMIGVGGAFDQFSGRVNVTPKWIQKAGIEWLYRLVHEPRRMWRRNFVHSSRYIYLYCIQSLLAILSAGKRTLHQGKSA